jgi:hypothetical protein
MGSQQSLPSQPLVTAFLPSHQTAFSQLASAYCGQLLGDATRRPAFFGSGLEGKLGLTAGSFFNTPANRQIVETALVTHAVGSNVSPDAANAVTAEVDALLQRIPTLSGTATVQTATTSACTAVLASAVVTLQ